MTRSRLLFIWADVIGQCFQFTDDDVDIWGWVDANWSERKQHCIRNSSYLYAFLNRHSCGISTQVAVKCRRQKILWIFPVKIDSAVGKIDIFGMPKCWLGLAMLIRAIFGWVLSLEYSCFTFLAIRIALYLWLEAYSSSSVMKYFLAFEIHITTQNLHRDRQLISLSASSRTGQHRPEELTILNWN